MFWNGEKIGQITFFVTLGSKYSNIRPSFVDLRWAQLYVSLVSSRVDCREKRPQNLTSFDHKSLNTLKYTGSQTVFEQTHNWPRFSSHYANCPKTEHRSPARAHLGAPRNFTPLFIPRSNPRHLPVFLFTANSSRLPRVWLPQPKTLFPRDINCDAKSPRASCQF